MFYMCVCKLFEQVITCTKLRYVQNSKDTK